MWEWRVVWGGEAAREVGGTLGESEGTALGEGAAWEGGIALPGGEETAWGE